MYNSCFNVSDLSVSADHGWTEIEEEYDDVGVAVRPVSSRAVSLM